MVAKGQAAGQGEWPPTSISEEKVKAATGRGWMGWFIILNRANANAMPHRQIAQLLHDKGCPSWWSQMIAVEYERARGGRKKHERPDGYSVSVSKVIPAALGRLFAVATDPANRKAWFPAGAFAETSKTKDKYWRGTWKKDARLEFGFYAKGAGKAQITVQINKLPDSSAVEKERAAWKKAMDKLAKKIDGRAG
ncbi:MAG: hypothetical protein JO261_10955 [Alphaproteobacteria bacterium]|nr:hypothetical protein [Alphaproteobacteria bacterium]MBV9694205.1 hypothetical protein [Alphaproteobacteria bacterium]